jgi:hypothetical protein
VLRPIRPSARLRDLPVREDRVFARTGFQRYDVWISSGAFQPDG